MCFENDILHIQNCIATMISLGMLHMTLWYFEYASFNAITFMYVKEIVSELLFFVVSMGYGMLQPTLEGII